MATDGKMALQAALYAALTAMVDDVEPPCPVYDIQAPQQSAFPYITIGEVISTPDDTKGDTALDVLATFHSWSRLRSKKESGDLLAFIYRRLHLQPLTVTGHSVTWCKLELDQIDLDPDGITHHGLARYRIRIEPTT